MIKITLKILNIDFFLKKLFNIQNKIINNINKKKFLMIEF